MKLLYVDTVTDKPYSITSVEDEAIGGSESSLARVAAALADRFDVTVAQSARRDADEIIDPSGVRYVALSRIREPGFIDPDVVVVLRKARPVAELAERFPRARLVLWLHNFVKPEFLRFTPTLERTGCRLVCTSGHHREHTDGVLNGSLLGKTARAVMRTGELPLDFIYNPIDDGLTPSGKSFDPNKLVFLSSPHKGIDQVLAAFAQARERIPELELHVANPGYEAGLESDGGLAELAERGIHVLGPLPHRQALEHVRDSLCVFYPQRVFPETFGLIYAEANAVGTPVLAHDLGSAREVLGPDNPLIDCNQTGLVVRAVADWHAGGRPRVDTRPEFRLARVAEQWAGLLES